MIVLDTILSDVELLKRAKGLVRTNDPPKELMRWFESILELGEQQGGVQGAVWRQRRNRIGGLSVVNWALVARQIGKEL
jgi:hypothetical protein